MHPTKTFPLVANLSLVVCYFQAILHPLNALSQEPWRVVVRQEHDDGCKSYRIPGLAVTTRGTLVACFDVRWDSAKDLPANIDVGVMRSSDLGRSWGAMTLALDYDKQLPGAAGNGVGDAAILVDRRSGDLYMAALWSYGNNGWHGSGPGLDQQSTGQLVITKSSDDGATWQPAFSITPQIKQPEWKLCFQGPGSGIQLEDGTLVFAAQYRDAVGKPSSCFISSHDGVSWKISPAAIPGDPPTSEAQLAIAGSNQLVMTMRNESRGPKRLWSSWNWKATLQDGSWSPHWSAVDDPVCMASLISLPSGILLCSHCDSKKRERISISYSRDQGSTWSQPKLLDSRPSAYSCMALLPDGTVGILYEVGDQHSTQTLTYANFSASWLGL